VAEDAIKPPPIRVAVAGIEPAPIALTPARRDWERLANLPPFQMWAAERLRSEHPGGRDSAEHARDVVRRLGAGDDVYAEYAEWHAAKGYWPDETPMGEAKR